MKIGYARVSTAEQSLDLQIDALKKVGCDEIFTDVISGSKVERPGLKDVFRFLRQGDTLIVWKLDRLGRSIKHLIETMQEIHKRNACFLSLQENIDTTTTMGKLVFHLFGALAEFERDIITERTRAGLIAARARGRCGGRRVILTNKEISRMRELYDAKVSKVGEICKIYNISRTTFYNYVPVNAPRKI